MIVYASKEKLIKFLRDEMGAWEVLNPNPNAFEFDPKTIDPKKLHEAGYYENIEGWIAGVRLNRLQEFINEIESLPQATNIK